MGAALAAKPSTGEQVVRIPAGLASYCLPERMDPTKGLTAVGALTSMTPSGSVFSRYQLGSEASRHVNIADMEFRPAGRAADRQPTDIKEAKAAKDTRPDLLYSVAWQVTQQLQRDSPSTRTLVPPRPRLLTDKKAVVLPRSQHMVQAVLRGLQTSKDGGARLRTYNVDSDQLNNASKQDSFQAQTVGIMRVAVQELSCTSFHHTDLSSQEPRLLGAVDSDAFGTRLRQGRQEVPLLLEQSTYTSSSAGGIPLGEGVIVTGGFGDIGSLTGAWAVLQPGVQHVILTGRSGRGPSVAAGFQDRNCLITGVMSNASAISDMHFLTELIMSTVSHFTRSFLLL